MLGLPLEVLLGSLVGYMLLSEAALAWSDNKLCGSKNCESIVVWGKHWQRAQ